MDNFENNEKVFGEKIEENIPAAEYNNAPYYNPPSNEYFNSRNPYAQNVSTPYIPFGYTPETYAERKDIRKRASNIGIPLLIMFGISFLWAEVYYFVMSALGFTPNKAYEIISEPAIMSVLQIALSMLMFTVPFVLCAKASGYRISDIVKLEKPEKGTVLPFFLFGIAFCAFANIVVSYASSIFESFGIDYSVDLGESPGGFFGFMLSLLSTVAVPALVEEFTCRGIVFGILKKYGDSFALVVSSVIFGVMHGNFEQIPFAFLVGLVLGFIRIKTNSLWVCVLVHAFNNFVSVCFEYFASDISVMAQNIIYMIFLLVCLLSGIFGILMLYKKDKKVYSFDKSDNACEEKQKYKWFFTSPIVIIFLILFLLESCIYFFV